MAIIIVDNFQVDINNPIDNRFVVGSQSIPSGGTYPTPFYAYRNDIVYKYPGLRIWDFNDNVPYVWDGTQWINENTTGALVQNAATGNTGFQDYVVKFANNQTLLTKSTIFDNASHVGIGLTGSAISPGIVSIPSNPHGLHVAGNIRTNGYFIGNGSGVTFIDAGNIQTGFLDLARIDPSHDNTGNSLIYVLKNVNNVTSWDLLSNIVPTSAGNLTTTITNPNLSTGYVYAGLVGSQYTFKPIVSTGLQITDNTNEVRIESKAGINIGSGGTDLYAGLDTDNRHKFKQIKSSTLQVNTDVNNNLTIEVPATFEGTDYYVNNGYIGTEQLGTRSKPFKELKSCLDKILNRVGSVSGTQNPLINGGLPYQKWEIRTGENGAYLPGNGSVRVIIQSYTETDENLAINKVTYFLEKGGYTSMIQVKNTSPGDVLEWIIDMEPLATNAPKTNGKLDYEISCNLEGNGTVAFPVGHNYRKGFFRAKGTNSLDLGVPGGSLQEQNDCNLTIGSIGGNINCIMYPKPSLSYTPITDENGTVITRESVTMNGYQTTSTPDYGCIQIEGRNAQFYDSLYLNGVLVINTQEQHMIYAKDWGTGYSDNGRIYMRRNYQQVLYSNIEYKVAYGSVNLSSIQSGSWYRVTGTGTGNWTSISVAGSWRTSNGTTISTPANGTTINATSGYVFKYNGVTATGTAQAGFCRKIYLPSEHVYDIYLKNGANFVNGGDFYTQQNTSANQGGADAFLCVENNTTDISRMCSFSANGGGFVTNLIYNSYFKSILNSTFVDYQHNNCSFKGLKLESSIYKYVINAVNTSNVVTWTKILTFGIFKNNCYLGDNIWYGNIRLPFSNMVINSKLFIIGNTIDLSSGLFNSNLPTYTNDSNAASDGFPIGGIYKDSTGTLKVRTT